MNRHTCRALVLSCLIGSAAHAADSQALIDPAATIEVNHVVTTSEHVTATMSSDTTAPGVNVAFKPGEEAYPGIRVAPQAPWDLSSFGHVEARIANTGSSPLTVTFRIDNAGDHRQRPWNAERAKIEPGQTKAIKIIFGYSEGQRAGYPLKSSAVSQLMLFASKPQEPGSFRVEAVTAGGPAGERPPIDLNAVRAKPIGGKLFGPGAATETNILVGRDDKPWATEHAGLPVPNVAMHVDSRGGVKASVDQQSIELTFPASAKEQEALLRPATGRWDLREGTQITLGIRNVGAAPIDLRAQATSNRAPTDLTPAVTVAPGAAATITIPFAPSVPFEGITPVTAAGLFGGKPGTGTRFVSDAVRGIRLATTNTEPTAIKVESIVIEAPVAQLPDWLGKRPPVEGDWVMTFNDEFDGDALDTTAWSCSGPNYWDSVSHWSKDNVIVGGGVVKMRYEKKSGFHNDDPQSMLDRTNPKASRSDYASGFLEAYGKKTQRYGYFESRMKLPRAQGLWPAFWIMPDRGGDAPRWDRRSTFDGGMEFDIMEHLTRWGPHRFNIGWHWDGYDKKTHKAINTEGNYVQPDPDGFITSGLLWLPGLQVYYCNGKEMARWEDERISNVPSYVMFTFVAGGWDNSSVNDAELPADFVIDYVRCWQRRDLITPP